MEAQPPPQPTPPPLSSVLPPPPHLNYPDSVDSSPRSRNTDSWDEPYPPPTTITAATTKLRLMVSYGGHISPRPHDKTLCYIGGDTRIIVVDRQISLSDLSTRLSKTFLNGHPFALKYQLPNEDLDSLISVATDEDLDNMIEEYDQRNNNSSSSSSKPSRIRLFLFPVKPDGPVSGLGSGKSEDWFMNALNDSGFNSSGLSDSASVNCLLGLDDEVVAAPGSGNNFSSGHEDGATVAQPGDGKTLNLNMKQGQDVHSVPDSPMLETNSSFGSSSSSPSAGNLPPIKVHVEDGSGGRVRGQDQKVVGIEEQFTQLGVGGVGQKQDEDIIVLTSPPAVAVAVPISAAAAVAGEYPNRVVSDDERSDHGVHVGYRKLPTSPPQIQSQSKPQAQGLAPQFQQKSTCVVDLPSPDSVSSDSSLTNAMSRPKPVNAIYQDQLQIQSGASGVPITSVDPNLNVSDPHSLIQMQHHVPDPGYVLQQHQFDQQHQQQQNQQAQQQQFLHGTHFIHHTPAGPVSIPAYYPVYPSQQQLHPQHHYQLDQQYPVYYVPARQAQAYNLAVQQANLGESTTAIPSSQPQNPPNPMVPPSAAYNPMRNAPLPNSETTASVYRTAAASTPQLVQVPTGQHQQQYVTYSQIHHPSQSVAPNSAAPANYAYNYADPAHAQIFYTQHLAPTMPSQSRP